jgi:hypothetical protein
LSLDPVIAPLSVRILGIGLVGPGMSDWASAAPALADPEVWRLAPTVVSAPQRLPAAERRRASIGVKLSILAADQACAAAHIDPATLATVFTSSTADPANCHALCEALAAPDRLVSPTRFTNSVHNAPSGYWHIATHAMRASTSLSAFDGSFAAGLLEAAAQCASTGEPVLLVACDVPYPEPLHALRPVPDSFALALLLGPSAEAGADPDASAEPASRVAATGPATPRLDIRLTQGETPLTACAHPGLEALRRGIPAARALPLLEALASPGLAPTSMVIEGLPGQDLHLTLIPC